MTYNEVVEGSTRLRIPVGGKLSKKDPVFYNPFMELARDVSVAVAKVVKPESYCDAFAGSGARGVRIANEAGCSVTLNDLNPRAVELVKDNLELNSVEAEVTQLDARKLLVGRRFDFVDVDPFGTPVPFIESAVQSLGNKGVLGVAATDTSALCGTYPKACRRKYDAVSLRTDYYNELGLRILLGFIARTALRYDYGVEVLFSHCTRHYFRAYVGLDRRRVKDTLEDLVYVQHCFDCMERGYKTLDELAGSCDCGGQLHSAGLLWGGVFAYPAFCAKLAGKMASGTFNKKADALKMIDLVQGEQAVLKPYFDLHKVCRKAGKPSPRMDGLSKALSDSGFLAARTHFSGVGLRTSAGVSDLISLINCIV